MTPTYRYLLCDLLTDRLLASVPLSGVTFERRISRVSSLQGQLIASNAEQVKLAKLMREYAGRSSLYVFRGSELWWGGIPWTVQAVQSETDPVGVAVTAATFDSYAHHRELYADLVYAGVDQGVIIPDLWRRIQAEPNGDIGVVAEDQPTGVLRDRAYLNSELVKVGKLIEDLGDVIDGPEHTVDVYVDGGGNRVKRLRVAQQLGSTVPQFVFQRAIKGGGRVAGWEHTSDAVDGGTSFRTRGTPETGNIAADNPPQLSTRVVREDLLAQGWPLLDMSADHDNTILADTLDGHAEALAAQHGGAMPTSGYTITVGSSGWNPNRVGDAVRLKLNDLWHDSTDTTVRPVGCKVEAPEKGKPERVTLLLGDED